MREPWSRPVCSKRVCSGSAYPCHFESFPRTWRLPWKNRSWKQSPVRSQLSAQRRQSLRGKAFHLRVSGQIALSLKGRDVFLVVRHHVGHVGLIEKGPAEAR